MLFRKGPGLSSVALTPLVIGILCTGTLLIILSGNNRSAWGSTSPIRIGYLQSDIHHLACWVALEKGFYKAEGVEVKVAGIFRAGPEEMTAFAAGALDMGYVGEAPATTAVANKAADVQVVSQVNTEGSAVVVGKASVIRSVPGLTGKRSAVPGHSTVQDFLLKKALAQAKVPSDNVNFIVIKPPEMIPTLRDKQIDAFIAWEPYPAKSITSGVGRILVSSGRIWKDHPCCVLVADSRFIKSRPQDVRRMVAAHVKATEFINDNFEDAVKIGVKYTGMDEETVRLAMKNVNYTYRISVEGEKDYVLFLNQLGYIKVEDVERFVKHFLNQKILQEILSP